MKEKEFISVIKSVLDNNYIGDDCAYLKDLGIVITQDTLTEDIHFSREKITPWQLGYKSVMVNLSDVAASGAEPKYLTVALSLPKNINSDFVKEFYKGAKKACGGNIQIVGGDITAADKIYVSICAIGKTQGRKISSRSNAKIGYKVVVAGNHGSSSAGLKLIQKNNNKFPTLIKAHLEPQAQIEFSKKISENIKQDYAMMDTSDGLMEALSTIANESKVLLNIDFDKIPHDKTIEQFENWQDFVLFGGEDYGIVAAISQDFDCGGTVIGFASDGIGVNLYQNEKIQHFSYDDVNNKIFNHFPQ